MKNGSISLPVLGLAVLALSSLPASQTAARPDGTSGPSSIPAPVGPRRPAGLGRRLDHDLALLRQRDGPDLDGPSSPNRTHKPGAMAKVYYGAEARPRARTTRTALEAGEIPQVAETYAFLNAAYPIMNEHQLAIGETTIGGQRRARRATKGIIDAPELYRLVPRAGQDGPRGHPRSPTS
ncbi:MAG: hypothetical protein M0C28_40535 [Candidatus Moduliflexus flocculans]|nr:hypothetical protein [Candidatus Moduliflexus flocculans]